MERDVGDVEREQAVLAAVRMAVRRYGVIPSIMAVDERVSADHHGAPC